MPYVYSTDADGKEYNFLADYYRTTQELVSNVFRKGYQWPFHATRTLDYGSSLVDLAIYRESRLGRTIWLDFTRNPQPVPGDVPFSLERLDTDVRSYLENNEALQETPIARLRQMNPLSIELYRQYRIDIAHAPLPFNVNHQHMNGGIEVDLFARTNLPGCYAVGEIAGTHGVTRPGGAALNAGQVFGQRAAVHIQRQLRRTPYVASTPETLMPALNKAQNWLQRQCHNPDGIPLEVLESEVQNRMSDHAGFICHVREVPAALKAAQELNQRLAREGVNLGEPRKLSEGVLRTQMALLSEAVLSALDYFIRQGGGSRGARMLCAEQGENAPDTRLGTLADYRFLAEKDAHKQEKILLRYDPEKGMTVYTRPLRGIEDTGKIHFEKNWGAYLTGDIYLL